MYSYEYCTPYSVKCSWAVFLQSQRIEARNGAISIQVKVAGAVSEKISVPFLTIRARGYLLVLYSHISFVFRLHNEPQLGLAIEGYFRFPVSNLPS